MSAATADLADRVVQLLTAIARRNDDRFVQEIANDVQALSEDRQVLQDLGVLRVIVDTDPCCQLAGDQLFEMEVLRYFHGSTFLSQSHGRGGLALNPLRRSNRNNMPTPRTINVSGTLGIRCANT